MAAAGVSAAEGGGVAGPVSSRASSTPASTGGVAGAESVLARVRRTCRDVLRGADDVSVSPEGVAAFLRDLDAEKFRSMSSEVTRPPLKFDTVESEVNYWCILNLLNFGSGYRHDLHKLCGRGAYETMMFGVLGMHISQIGFDADFLCDVALYDVANYFNLSKGMDIEVEVMPAVYESKPGPLRPLAKQICAALNSTGKVLKERGYKTLGAFVLAAVSDRSAKRGADGGSAGTIASTNVSGSGSAGAGAGAGSSGGAEEAKATDGAVGEAVAVVTAGAAGDANTGPSPAVTAPAAGGPSAAALVELLVTTFPGFRDIHAVDGTDVYVCKKAQIAVADLYRLFGSSEPSLNFTDINDLTVFTDNVVPAVLRKLGVIKVSDELAGKIEGREELPAGPTEVRLRAAAIVAADDIVAASEGAIENAMLLDYYLWSLGKEGDFRTFERHATRDTYFY